MSYTSRVNLAQYTSYINVLFMVELQEKYLLIGYYNTVLDATIAVIHV